MRRSLPLVGVGALVGAYWLPGTAAVVPAAARRFGIPTRAARGPGVVLTFDDGPHPSGTPAVLAALQSRGAHAVFFVSGEQVARHPEIVCEIVSSGHELGLHGYRHQTRRQWSGSLLVDDTRRALDAVGRRDGLDSTPVPTAARCLQRGGVTSRPETRPRAAALVDLGPGLGGTRHRLVDHASRDRRDQGARRHPPP